MLEQINIETHLLDDERIQALIDDYGLAGLGAYLLLRTQIDAQPADQGLPTEAQHALHTQRQAATHATQLRPVQREPIRPCAYVRAHPCAAHACLRYACAADACTSYPSRRK